MTGANQRLDLTFCVQVRDAESHEEEGGVHQRRIDPENDVGESLESGWLSFFSNREWERCKPRVGQVDVVHRGLVTVLGGFSRSMEFGPLGHEGQCGGALATERERVVHALDVEEAVQVPDVDGISRAEFRSEGDLAAGVLDPDVEEIHAVHAREVHGLGVTQVGGLEFLLLPAVLGHEPVVDVHGPVSPLTVQPVLDVLALGGGGLDCRGLRLLVGHRERDDVNVLDDVDPARGGVEVVEGGLEHEVPVHVLVEFEAGEVGQGRDDLQLGLVLRLPVVDVGPVGHVRDKRLQLVGVEPKATSSGILLGSSPCIDRGQIEFQSPGRLLQVAHGVLLPPPEVGVGELLDELVTLCGVQTTEKCLVVGVVEGAVHPEHTEVVEVLGKPLLPVQLGHRPHAAKREGGLCRHVRLGAQGETHTPCRPHHVPVQRVHDAVGGHRREVVPHHRVPDLGVGRTLPEHRTLGSHLGVGPEVEHVHAGHRSRVLTPAVLVGHLGHDPMEDVVVGVEHRTGDVDALRHVLRDVVEHPRHREIPPEVDVDLHPRLEDELTIHEHRLG